MLLARQEKLTKLYKKLIEKNSDTKDKLATPTEILYLLETNTQLTETICNLEVTLDETLQQLADITDSLSILLRSGPHILEGEA